ncbi:hypothetical protein BCV69DRAFT_282676 [Microstroma glucosiphilum]|uniref:sphingolipid 4-desaturase n=1 Tax=Pseudomicrostroma glucosiphilum TaxID=1684307 RepID=A0A316U7Q4_9BASI|nr:hypothetical protein BCV69DRAFT_282676 [Pseudomicrostroma glucosiphilum]PWN21182.1 hypothetical protein BCV69DRAFT_282676 [Pseudomicrostroma glucosiphilum]
MLGFDSTPRSVSLDWSYFGGAEELPPWLRKVAKRTVAAIASPHQQSTSSDQSEAGSSSLDSSSFSGSTLASDDEQDEVNDLLSSSDAASSSSSLRASPASLAHPTLDGTPWLPKVLAQDPSQDQNDFLWLLTEEPHRSRRQAIMKAHPEVKTLMGREPLTKWISLGVVLVQLATAYATWKLEWHPLSWRFLAAAYAIGGTANQNIFLAIHEITHNLAFRGIKANKLWAILVNSVIGVPYAMMFKQYHIEHHKYLGEDGVDTDLPTRLELMCLKNVLGKAFFATFQIFFYAFRPGFIKTQRLTVWHLLNISYQILFNAALVYYFSSWTPLLYLVFSSFFAGSLHPCAAHFIAEHYLFGGIAQETWSYYGPLNILAYNVGYHNEHHDFPSIPWTRLPALRAMAPEFYDCLPCHTSWPMVTVQFILGTDSGLFARIKRVGKGVAREMGEEDKGDVQGHELKEKTQ